MSAREFLAALPSFDPPAPKPGFTVATIRADEVQIGDWHIPMEGENFPVGKGQTWRRCDEVLELGGSVSLGWPNDRRWYHCDSVVHVLRPIP